MPVASQIVLNLAVNLVHEASLHEHLQWRVLDDAHARVNHEASCEACCPHASQTRRERIAPAREKKTCILHFIIGGNTRVAVAPAEPRPTLAAAPRLTETMATADITAVT